METKILLTAFGYFCYDGATLENWKILEQEVKKPYQEQELPEGIELREVYEENSPQFIFEETNQLAKDFSAILDTCEY